MSDEALRTRTATPSIGYALHGVWFPGREFNPQPPCRSQKVIEGVGLAVVVEPYITRSKVGSLPVSQTV